MSHPDSKHNRLSGFWLGAGLGAVVLFGLWLTTGSNKEKPKPVSKSAQAQWDETLANFSTSPEVELSQQGRLVADFEVTDEMVEDLKKLDGIETLILDQGVVTDKSLDAIAGLPSLVHLRLRLSPISDAGFEKLSHCGSLQILNLPQANCTSAGIRHLTKLPKLRQLRLGSNNLGSDPSEAIAELNALESLHLIGVKVTNDGLKQIATLPELQSLYLDDSDVTEEGWDWLFENRPGLHIHVDQNHLDRDPKKHDH